MDRKEMSMILVRLVKREVERATSSLIDAEAKLAEVKVREEWEQREVDEMLRMGNRYSEQVQRSKVNREACKKELDRWIKIQDFVVETFVNNS